LFIQATIALLACFSAFIVPVGILSMALLGFTDTETAMDILKTWLAYIGPFAGSVIGYYFQGRLHAADRSIVDKENRHRSHQPRSE
jgi:hypothetical protein